MKALQALVQHFGEGSFFLRHHEVHLPLLAQRNYPRFKRTYSSVGHEGDKVRVGGNDPGSRELPVVCLHALMHTHSVRFLCSVRKSLRAGNLRGTVSGDASG